MNIETVRKRIAVLVLSPFFLVCAFLLVCSILKPETFEIALAQFLAYSSHFSGLITFILGYYFGSKKSGTRLNRTQLWITYLVLGGFVSGSAFLTLAPVIWYFDLTQHSLLFKAFEGATSGFIGVIAGFYYGR